VGIARLTVAGIAHRLALNLEQSDDLKLAVTEACGFLLEHTPNGEPINLDFAWADDKFRVTVGIGPHSEGADDLPVDDHDNLGLFLIHALMDDVRSINHGRTLVLSKDLSRRIDE
jgi:serine/threonine-protein kinase RsbW